MKDNVNNNVNKTGQNQKPITDKPTKQQITNGNTPKDPTVKYSNYYYNYNTTSVYNGSAPLPSQIYSNNAFVPREYKTITQENNDLVNGIQKLEVTDKNVVQSTSIDKAKQLVIVRNNQGEQQSVEQKVSNTSQSRSVISVENSQNVSAKQIGDSGSNTLLTELKSGNNVTMESNAGDNLDELYNITKDSSNSTVILNGDSSRDTLNELIMDSSNNKIYLNGNNQNSPIDNHPDEIRLAIKDNNNKNNEIFINSSVQNSFPLDNVNILVPENTNLDAIKYDSDSKTINLLGNNIHLGNNIGKVSISYKPTLSLDERIDQINKLNIPQSKKVEKIKDAKASAKNGLEIMGETVNKDIIIREPNLPNKIEKLIEDNNNDPKELAKLRDNLSLVYNDPDGKKLLDKMAKQNTKILLKTEEEFQKVFPENNNVDGYYSDYNNTIYIKKDTGNTVDTIVHEMAHGSTGHNSGFSFLGLKYNYTRENDGNSLSEELHNELLSQEVINRIDSKTTTTSETKEAAKQFLLNILSSNLYENLPIDNGFLDHIQANAEVDVQTKFNVEDLYKELLKEEDPKNPVPRLPQFKHIWEKY